MPILLLLLLLLLFSISSVFATCTDPLASSSSSSTSATCSIMSSSESKSHVPTTSQPRFPVLFMSHFGGPNFYVDHRIHNPQMKEIDTNSIYAKKIRTMRQQYGWVEGGKYGKPRALLVVSAHWCTSQVRITGQERYKTLYYDYGEFGIDNKDVTYPAPGDKQISQKILSVLSKAGIAASIDDKRNFDHGCFNILHVLFPDADIPVIQVSILSHFDPATHITLGEALSPLRDEGIFIIGSGEITHNFAPTKREQNLKFSSALHKILEDKEITSEQRYKHLKEWEKLPNARIAHAQEDHFMPLHVIVGAAKGAPAKRILEAEMGFGGMHFVADSYMFE